MMPNQFNSILSYLKSFLVLSIILATNTSWSTEPVSAAAKSTPAIKFTNANMTAACAPHDASSIMISILTEKKEYPLITINWWAESKPSAKGGVFNFESKGKDPFADGYQGYFCMAKGICEQLKKVKLKVSIDPKTKASTVQFDVETEKNEVQKGEVPSKVNFDTQHMCG